MYKKNNRCTKKYKPVYKKANPVYKKKNNPCTKKHNSVQKKNNPCTKNTTPCTKNNPCTKKNTTCVQKHWYKRCSNPVYTKKHLGELEKLISIFRVYGNLPKLKLNFSPSEARHLAEIISKLVNDMVTDEEPEMVILSFCSTIFALFCNFSKSCFPPLGS